MLPSNRLNMIFISTILVTERLSVQVTDNFISLVSGISGTPMQTNAFQIQEISSEPKS